MWFYNTNKSNERASKNVQVDHVEASKFGDVVLKLFRANLFSFTVFVFLISSLQSTSHFHVNRPAVIERRQYHDLPSNVQHKNHVEKLRLRCCFPFQSWQIVSLSVSVQPAHMWTFWKSSHTDDAVIFVSVWCLARSEKTKIEWLTDGELQWSLENLIRT